jgi:REP element-mobilizing transposase RayT
MSSKKTVQLKLLKNEPKAYGGELLKTREGRSRGRPIDTKHTMHLVLRSSKARGDLSFWRKDNKSSIHAIFYKFAKKYGVKIHSMANVGNHLHLHVHIRNRFTYAPFIRATTSAIVTAVTSNVGRRLVKAKASDRFWDYRPFTRIVLGYRALLVLKDYLEINRLEGFGFQRDQARFFTKWERLPDEAPA